MRTQALGTSLLLGALLLLAPLSSSCTEVRLLELGQAGDECRNTGECDTGLVCDDMVCVSADGGGGVFTGGRRDGQPDADAGAPSDVEGDATPPLGPDVEDAGPLDVLDPSGADIVDALPDLPPDVGGGDTPQETLEDEPDVEEPEPEPEPEPQPQPEPEPEIVETVDEPEVFGDDGGPLGEVIEDVDTGPTVPGLGDPCVSTCDLGMVCLEQEDESFACAPFPDGVCWPCEGDGDCLAAGSKCLTFPTGDRFCGSACGSNTDCPPSFLCSQGQCQPETLSCVCTPELLGFSLGCVNQTDEGLCKGQVTCQIGGWSKCSAAPPQQEICDGVDNDCDGIIDEEPFYIEEGKLLPFGAPCGIGQCGDGEVTCAPDGSAVCSTNVFATPEACADNDDNDCDGAVNEGCESTDYDGDGTDNHADCRPTDSAYHPGASEPCCPPALGNDPDCDFDCDGSVTACAGCDQDFDGHCPPADCDDGNAHAYPGAPDKCGDGVDQDCVGGDLTCEGALDSDGDGYVPPADCNEGNPAVFPWANELCDNLDNDCDGVTDEGNPQAGQPCGTTAEYCKSGEMVCTHYGYGAAIQCQGAIVEQPEKCDGIDNDCNGQIDEAWPDLGGPCDGPDVDACKNGVLQCTPSGSGTLCSDELVTNIVEVCNDIDDDCDGGVDEFACKLYDLDGDGWTEAQGDCDDFRSEVNPGADEPCCDPGLGAQAQKICDLDCNGVIAPCAFADGDADGFTAAQGDCDDEDPLTHPGAVEKCDDGIDQDCVAGDLACNTVSDKDFDGFHSGIDCNDTNAQVNPWAKEVCNFIDDDCDLLIDEGNPTGKFGGCGPNVAECPPGEWVCVHDLKTSTIQVVCVVPGHFQGDEICNSLDDDCDGEVDETYFDLGLPCDGPDSDHCANGPLVCNADGSGVTCGDELLTDLAESCDTIDNDCDGETDEGLNYEGIGLGEVCDGVGQCGAGVVICNFFQTTTCSTNPDGPFSQAKPETCNGKDDDCDGETDENFFYKNVQVGGACDGVGQCGAGTVECASASQATCSTNPNGSEAQPHPELCDGVDNDCDNHVDEDIGLVQSDCKSAGVCAKGGVAAQCKLAAWQCDYSAVAGYQPEETLCDGIDNDCDGATDDTWPIGLPCDGGDSDLCPTGTWACAPDGLGAECVGETNPDIVEVCNGLDDDCDGLTDEVQADPAGAGCKSEGVCILAQAIVVYCGADGLVCDYSGIAGYEDEETLCDGADNDCDGLTDEDLTYGVQPLGAPCEGKGACGQGVVECSLLKKKAVCSTEAGGSESQASLEECNTYDDDCDGLTDEDFVLDGVPVGEPCDGSGDCGSAVGVVECLPPGAGGGTLCSTSPGGSQDQSQSEMCDGQDNDCDGFTDEAEDMDPALSPCPIVGVCGSTPLVATCESAEWVCHHTELPGYKPIENDCDDLDNNCNGVTDEGFPLKGDACDGNDADQCATGTWTCALNKSGLVCDNESDPDQVEICDQKDNDCDGFTDNGQHYKGLALGQLCDGLGECGPGVVLCAQDGTATCSTNPNGTDPQASAEVCDQKDNDCDGITDDGLTWKGTLMGQPCDGIGACPVGFVVCSPATGQPTCSTNPDGTTPGDAAETCDGKDNDCDGDTDEEYANAGMPCDSADSDLCKTGTKSCLSGQELCLGDTPCLPGTQCQAALPPQTDTCLCWQTPCDTGSGDTCIQPSGGATKGTCLCAGGPSCVAPQTCTPGVGCE